MPTVLTIGAQADVQALAAACNALDGLPARGRVLSPNSRYASIQQTWDGTGGRPQGWTTWLASIRPEAGEFAIQGEAPLVKMGELIASLPGGAERVALVQARNRLRQETIEDDPL